MEHLIYADYEGFVDDNEYSNLFGITGGKAKRINAENDRIRAEAERVKAESDARMNQVAQELDAADQARKKAKELQKKLEELDNTPLPQYTPPTPTPTASGVLPDTGLPAPTGSNMKKILIIGGISLAVVVGLVVILRK